MKKLLIMLLLLSFLTSCGPRRLRCGPGRCEMETPIAKTSPLKNIC